MKISTRGEYGLRAMMELTRRYGEGYIQNSAIAASRSIPENYLYQLLITLRKAGLIRSRRGPQGGHMLARLPENINLAEAVIALEGPLAPVTCIEEDAISDCAFCERCVIREVWREVTDATREILERTTFADLARQEREQCEDHTLAV